jgi:hypothetical protein
VTFTTEKARSIPLEKLRPAPWNVNRVSGRTLKKIRRSIIEFGFVENLVARPHPTEEGAFEVLSGNHRLKILKDAGEKAVPVVVVDVDDAHARILAQTMNRTRGRDDPVAYRKLVTELLEVMSADEIAAFLPYEKESIESSGGEQINVEVPAIYGVIVDCADEADQVKVLNAMLEEGRPCRALMT